MRERDNVGDLLRRADRPVAGSFIRTDQFAIVGKHHLRRGVAQVETKLWCVLVMRQVIARERMPQTILRPAETGCGGELPARGVIAVSARGINLSGPTRIRTKPLGQI